MTQLAKRHHARAALLALLTILVLAGPAISEVTAFGKFKRVLIVILENTSFETARKQPFLSTLSDRGAVLTNFTAVARPSQPNYIALISGSTFDVNSNRNVDLKGRHIGDLLEAKGQQWKVYAEAYPGKCYLGARHGTYVRKHVPFLSFTNVQQDPARCARIVDSAQLQTDIENGSLPDYALYIPDLNNDGHDTDARYADRWLSSKFGPLLEDPRFTRGLLLIVTYDEGKRSFLLPSSNRVLTILVGDSVAPGVTSDAPYSHYSLLRLVEDGLGLGSLSRNDAIAAPVSGIWK